MKKRTWLQMGAAALAAGLLLTPTAAVFASGAGTADTAEEADLRAGDMIDITRTGSLTIRKYDITAAEAKGAYVSGSIQATGQSDARVESALSGYSIEGVRFAGLRLGSIKTRSTKTADGTSVEVVYEIPTQLAAVLGLTGRSADSCYSSDELNAALAAILSADNIQAKNALENYVKSSKDAFYTEPTDSDGYTSVSGLALGLYLIVEAEVPENVTDTVNPWFVSLPFTDNGGEQWLYDMTCYPKNQTGNPTLDKRVRNHEDADREDGSAYDDTATASEGDTLDYLLVSKIPHITSAATALSCYTFEDELSAGLTYNEDACIAFYHDAQDAEENNLSAADLIWDTPGAYFTQTYFENEEGVSSFTTELTADGLAQVNSCFSDCYMVVYYTAQLNKDRSVVLGDDGNPNDATLTWSRTAKGYYDQLNDRNYVYSYGLDLTKEFSDRKGDFSKVSFRLYNASDDCYVTAKKTADGVYEVTGQSESADQAALFVPASDDGTLLINGMEADTYRLTETSTDDGYSLLKDPILIEIISADREITASTVGYTEADRTEMIVGPVESGTATVDGLAAEMKEDRGSLNASVVLGVTNTHSFLLPQTGGDGLYAVTAIGAVIAAAGSFAAFGSRRKEGKNASRA